MRQREPDPLAIGAVVAVSAAAAAGVGSLVAAMLRRRRPKPKPAATIPSMAALMEDPRVRSVAETARTALEQAKATVESSDREAMRRELARRVEPLVAAARTDLPPLTKEATQRALRAAERLREEGTERLRTDVQPAARTLAQEAVAEAEEILAAARERAADLSESAEEYLPQVGARAAALAGLAAGSATAAAQQLGARLSGAIESRRRQSQRARKPGVRQRSGAAVQRAGASVVSATTESALILFWAGALSAVVYFGVLNQQQRERVRRAVTGVYQRARRMVEDRRSGTA